MAKERDHILAKAVADLPEADRRVITLYYREGLMLKEIAEVLAVTKSRVSQIHARALFRLRARIAALARHRAQADRRAVS
jgi:RNA polymerase sigma factor for flagellar operon FliA